MMIALIAGLLAVGMVLLFAEIAVIPGFGIAGISAIVLLAAGVALAWLQYGPSAGIGSLAATVLMAAAAVWIAPRTRAGRSLILKSAITAQHGDPELVALLGREGVALTALRPAGAVEIDGRRVDVVAGGGFIAAGTTVRVSMVEGARVVVEPVAPKEA